MLIIYRSLALAQIKTTPQSSYENYCQCEHVFNISDTNNTTLGQTKILKTGFEMAILNMNIIKGSCWDYVNEVYKRSGIIENKETIYNSKKRGPYAPQEIIKPGDWIYHINHQLNNGEHSAIFICWKDYKKKIAITLSYAGMNRKLPGYYNEYKLDKIYTIFRPKK